MNKKIPDPYVRIRDDVSHMAICTSTAYPPLMHIELPETLSFPRRNTGLYVQGR
ncbi:hypothetical protein D3C76_1531180 [compost metagenome]